MKSPMSEQPQGKKESTYDKLHDRYRDMSGPHRAGIKYERLAALVFKSLEEKGAVIHDLKLTGDSEVKSQIDVIIENPPGSQKRVLIECKDFDISGENIDISIVRCFWAVVDDLKPTAAMIITCNDFTAPAKQYAAHKNIKLGILRQIKDSDLEDLITRIDINFIFETTPEASIGLLFPNEEIIREFQQCTMENGIQDISLSDSEVYFDGPDGEIKSVNEFVNTKVDAYRQENPTHEYGSIPVNLSGYHIKVKDVAKFPINAGIIFMRHIYSTKLESYSERIAEMILHMFENEGNDIIIFGDDLERFEIDPVTHEVGLNPNVVEIPGWDRSIVKGTTLTWTKLTGETLLRIIHAKDKSTNEYAITGLVFPLPPQAQWLVKDGRRYEWSLQPKDLQRVLSGESVDTPSERGDDIAEDVSNPQKMASYLEKLAVDLSQLIHDLILWILNERGGKMELDRLRWFTGRDYDFLNPILEELAKEGRIEISGESVSLIH